MPVPWQMTVFQSLPSSTILPITTFWKASAVGPFPRFQIEINEAFSSRLMAEWWRTN
jgi:hypothetical protein